MTFQTLIQRVSLACVAICFALGAAVPAAEPVPAPIIPISTTFDYWDQHWFIWLPNHPVYELVEVASRAVPGQAERQLWVWFTERAGGKAQVNYYNAQYLAGGRPESFVVPISVEQPDGAGSRSIHVAFADREGKSVDISIHVDAAGDLKPAGLTDQSGHAAGSVFLIFYRETEQLASRNQVTIDGKDYSFNSMDGVSGSFPFMAAYSEGIYIATIPYAGAHVAVSDGALAQSWGRNFVQDDGGTSWTASTPRGDTLQEKADEAGGLRSLSHRFRGHELKVDFDTPLVLPAAGTNTRIPFRVSLDEHAALISGDIEASNPAGTPILDWRPDRPRWASASPFRTTVTWDDDGKGYTLAVRPGTKLPSPAK